MIIENYKDLIVKKNNINYNLFQINVYNSIGVGLIGSVFRINGKADCDITSCWIDINTITIINNRKYSNGVIKIYYPSSLNNLNFLFQSYENMIIKYKPIIEINDY